MKEFPHIDSVYKRDQQGKFIIGEYSTPEFKYLEDTSWTWTEKIDGTNIRIMWRGLGEFPTIGGKTDNAQIPAKLVAWLNERISADKFAEVFPDMQPLSSDDRGGICLYGEGYGAGIQSGGLYSPEQKFILFDVKIGHWWLKKDAVEDIAAKLGLDVVPSLAEMPLNIAVALITRMAQDSNLHKRSSIGTALIEGVVGTPSVPLYNRKGGRIIVKVKVKDFKNA